MSERKLKRAVRRALAMRLGGVGKLGIRDDVLLKPGKLTDDEFETMKSHVEHGLDITSRARWLNDAGDRSAGHGARNARVRSAKPGPGWRFHVRNRRPPLICAYSGKEKIVNMACRIGVGRSPIRPSHWS